MHSWHRSHHRSDQAHTNGSCSLVELHPGEVAQVISLHGGHFLVSRMAAMGFTPGVEVSLIQNAAHGPLIASVRGARVAIGRGEARKILVRLQESNDTRSSAD